MQITPCKVEKVEALTTTIQRIVLAPCQPFNFIAGQYLQVVMAKDDKRPFSIANAPREDGRIELHIGAEPGNLYATQVVDKCKVGETVEIEGGLGEAHLDSSPTQPIILLAGGTGFSYTLSILQALLSEPLSKPIHLYWGARKVEDMYAFDELNAFSAQYPLFKFIPVVEFPDDSWSGKSGWVHQAVLDDKKDLSDYQVYVAGRFEMAKVVRDDFVKQGLSPNNLFGDAYAFI